MKMMKMALAGVVGAALLATSLTAVPAEAAPHGGFHGGYHGGYGGYRGGYRGYRGYGGYPYFVGGVLLGAALWSPWYYGYPGYYYDYPDPYYYGPPVAAPPPGVAPAPAAPACGSWVWDAANAKYNWVTCAAPAR